MCFQGFFGTHIALRKDEMKYASRTGVRRKCADASASNISQRDLGVVGNGDSGMSDGGSSACFIDTAGR
jgi:hypothetical protein